MVKLAINELTTYRWSFEEDVFAVAQHGFEGVGLWRPKLTEYGLEKAVELLQEHRLEVSSLSWAGGFTGSDGRSYHDSLQDAQDAVHTAARIGAKTVIMLAGGRNNHTRNHAQRMILSAFQELSDLAARWDINLALEPVHRGCGAEWSLVHNVRQTLDLLGTLNRSNVGLTLDTYHLGFDRSILSWLPSVVNHIQIVQLGDGKHLPLGEQNRCLLGEGLVPLEEIIAVLLQAGYDGFWEAEVLGEEVEHMSYDAVLEHTRDFMSGMIGGAASQCGSDA